MLPACASCREACSRYVSSGIVSTPYTRECPELEVAEGIPDRHLVRERFCCLGGRRSDLHGIVERASFMFLLRGSIGQLGVPFYQDLG